MTSHNLPHSASSFIGRKAEISGIYQQLLDPACRLLTLLAPGGTGKTRLAIEVARQFIDSDVRAFPDGIVFVPLAALQDAGEIDFALANHSGIKLQPGESAREQVLDFFASRRMLLIMDNFEHLTGRVDLIADLLQDAPGIVVLVTSRERLMLQEEWVMELDGLSFPDTISPENYSAFDAINLFITRAHKIKRNFAHETVIDEIVHLCQLVEGMPLALELAASWSATMPVAAIVGQVENDLNFLSTNLRNIEDRHRTIRTVFDYSWSLLTETERRVFRGLSIFQGGFTMEAAQAVTQSSLHVLSDLVSKSFIRLNANGQYDIHSLMRQYGLEQLQASVSEHRDVQEKHLIYYAELLAQLGIELKGANPTNALDTIYDDMANITVAWQYALTEGKRDALAIMLETLSLYFRIRGGNGIHDLFPLPGNARQGLRELDQVLYAKITLLLSRAVYRQPDVETGAKLAREGLAVWRNLDGDRGTAAYELAAARPPLLYNLMQADTAYYRELYQTFVDDLNFCRENHNVWGVGWALYCLACLAKDKNNIEEAHDLFRESVDVFRSGEHYWSMAPSLFGVERSLRLKGQFQESREALLEVRAINQSVGDILGILSADVRLTELTYLEGDYRGFKKRLLETLQTALIPIGHKPFYELISMSIDVLKSTDDILEIGRAVAEYFKRQTNPEHLHDFCRKLSRWLLAWTDRTVHWHYDESPDFEALAAAIVAHFEQPATEAANLSLDEPLTARQLEILSYLATGCTNKEIASRLFITPGTVRVHTHQIFQKLNVSNRTQAVAEARNRGLLDIDQ